MGRPDASLSLIARIVPWTRRTSMSHTLKQSIDAVEAAKSAEKAATDAQVKTVADAEQSVRDAARAVDDARSATVKAKKQVASDVRKKGDGVVHLEDGTELGVFKSENEDGYYTEPLSGPDTEIEDDPEAPPADGGDPVDPANMHA